MREDIRDISEQLAEKCQDIIDFQVRDLIYLCEILVDNWKPLGMETYATVFINSHVKEIARYLENRKELKK